MKAYLNSNVLIELEKDSLSINTILERVDKGSENGISPDRAD